MGVTVPRLAWQEKALPSALKNTKMHKDVLFIVYYDLILLLDSYEFNYKEPHIS